VSERRAPIGLGENLVNGAGERGVRAECHAPGCSAKRTAHTDGLWASDAVLNTYITARLAPTAERILAAAYAVLAREGYAGLTLRRIAEEAGEHKSLIIYHFHSKSALVALLVDYLWHGADVDLVERLRALPDELQPRVGALIAAHRTFAGDAERNRMYLDLLPPVLRDNEARQRLARVYAAYRQLNVSCLQHAEIAADRLPLLGAILLAVGEGLPVQMLADPGALDGSAVFDVLAALTLAYLESGRNSRGTPIGRGVSSSLQSSAPGPRESGVSQTGGRGDGLVGEGGLQMLGSVLATGARGADLSRTGRNILRGARRVLRKRGLDAVTLEAVADAAGEARSSVSYHFGDKQGLVTALVDDVLHDQRQAIVRVLRRAMRESGRIDIGALLRAATAYLSDLTELRSFYNLLPAVLRDDAKRARLAEWQRSLRMTIATCLAPDPERALDEPFVSAAALSLAALHGLAIQAIIDPGSFSPSLALGTLGELLGWLPAATRGDDGLAKGAGVA